MPLVAEPSGAEIARPGREADADDAALEHPDPDGELPADTTPLIRVRAVAIPSTDEKSPAYRIHIEFEPNAETQGHWNNESGLSLVWIDPPAGWQSISKAIPLADPNRGKHAVGTEPRRAEFELKPAGGSKGAPEEPLRCVAFYYVCEEASGTCQYLRSEIEIELD